MSLLGNVHGKVVHNRRVSQLSRHLSELLPNDARVLDVGCGDGLIASLIKEKRPDILIEGIDVLVRSDTFIEVKEYDGKKIPFADGSFDAVMFVDVLHHTDDPLAVLREARRIASKALIIKDHTDDGFLSNQTLSFMDWVGNKPHGVRLPYNYWTSRQWNEAVKTLNLKKKSGKRTGYLSEECKLDFRTLTPFVARLAC